MSKKLIKIPREIAKNKIATQHDSGISLAHAAIDLIKEGKSKSNVDTFKIKYDHWQNITSEVLNEVFLSTDYSYKFRKQRSSKAEYVSSSWQPDIEYFLHKEIKQKIDYLKMLVENINDFDEDTSEENQVSEDRNEINSTNMEQLDNSANSSQTLTSMSIKDRFESHPVIWGLSLLCIGFVSGFGVRPYVIPDRSIEPVPSSINCTVAGVETLEQTHNMRMNTLQTQLMKLEASASDHNLIPSYQREYKESADRVRKDINIETSSYKEALQQLKKVCE